MAGFPAEATRPGREQAQYTVPTAAEQANIHAQTADQAPAFTTVGNGAQSGLSAAQAEHVAALRAKAAEFLRVRNGVEFRAVEAQLQEFGASARPTAALQTSMGSITIRLFPDYAPETVRNFIELAQGARPWIDSREPEPLRQRVRLYDAPSSTASSMACWSKAVTRWDWFRRSRLPAGQRVP